MTTTSGGLPLMQQTQSSRYLTYNELAWALNVLQTGVLDRDLSTPPGSPTEGDAYIVASGGTGAWSGEDDSIAFYFGGIWNFLEPEIGQGNGIYVQDEGVRVRWDAEASPASYAVLSSSADASDVTYTPTTLADWDGGVDPGDGQEAFDQLAERVTDLESAGGADASAITYTPADNSDWGGSDPGNVDDALDYLAANAGGGSLTNWTEAVNTSAPNATVPVVSFTATNAATNVDAALIAKGSGAILAQIPDGTSTAGNKRGAYATDLQKRRSTNSRVASGQDSVICGGENNSATGTGAVCVGGASNQATNTRACIVGGDANTASGEESFLGGGDNNTVSQTQAVVCGGFANTASQAQAFVGGGSANTASAQYSSIPGGQGNTADGVASHCSGQYASARGIHGVSAHASGRFATTGDAQTNIFVLRSDTTTATPEALTTDNTAAGTNDQVILPNNSIFAFRGDLVVRENATGDSKAVKFEGAIKRGANAAATALVGSPSQTTLGEDAGAAGWTVGFTADTTNGGLAITVTGEASHTLRWVARVVTTEVVG